MTPHLPGQQLRRFFCYFDSQNGNSFLLCPDAFLEAAADPEDFLPAVRPDLPEEERELFSSKEAFRDAFFPAVASISLIRLSWFTSLAPGS